MKWPIYILLIAFLFSVSPFTFAAADDVPPEIIRFDESTYDDLAGDADYFKDHKEKKKKQSDTKEIKRRGMGEISLGPLKYVLLGMVILLIVFLLLKVFAGELFLGNKKLAKSFPVSLEDLEEHLEDAPMQKFLNECLANGDYTNAVRIYYLMILQKLNSNGLINWHKQKTNSHYLFEMRLHKRYPLFLSLTSVFERVYYGEHYQLSQSDFVKVEPGFKEMLNSLESRNERK